MGQREEQVDTVMVDTSLSSSIRTATSKAKSSKTGKSREIFSCTISRPPFAYAQIEVVCSQQHPSGSMLLDALQVRSYCDAALKQFLGATGAAMPLDLLKIDGREAWLRLPREDLGLFAAALTAWRSVGRDGTATIMRLKASSNWLGSLIGRTDQRSLWRTT